jgi:hypothetical protein
VAYTRLEWKKGMEPGQEDSWSQAFLNDRQAMRYRTGAEEQAQELALAQFSMLIGLTISTADATSPAACCAEWVA